MYKAWSAKRIVLLMPAEFDGRQFMRLAGLFTWNSQREPFPKTQIYIPEVCVNVERRAFRNGQLSGRARVPKRHFCRSDRGPIIMQISETISGPRIIRHESNYAPFHSPATLFSAMMCGKFKFSHPKGRAAWIWNCSKVKAIKWLEYQNVLENV